MFKRRRNYSDADPIRFICDVFSPDSSLRCDQEMGHLGWHRNGDSASWHGNVWDCDHWADTQERVDVDPEPTMDAREWDAAQPKPKPESAPKAAPKAAAEPEPVYLIGGKLAALKHTHPKLRTAIFCLPIPALIWSFIFATVSTTGLVIFILMSIVAFIAFMVADHDPTPPPEKLYKFGNRWVNQNDLFILEHEAEFQEQKRKAQEDAARLACDIKNWTQAASWLKETTFVTNSAGETSRR